PALSRRASRLFRCSATPTPEFYPLSLHDALPISPLGHRGAPQRERGQHGQHRHRREPPEIAAFEPARHHPRIEERQPGADQPHRSEEHTSELQSRENLVCRLLLEKKKHSKPTYNL